MTQTRLEGEGLETLTQGTGAAKTRLEGEGLEALTQGTAGSKTRLEGMGLEVATRLPPGFARVTTLDVQVAAVDFPGETRVTKLDTDVLTLGEPSEARVTHLYENTLVNEEPGGARVTHLYVNVLVIFETPPPEAPELENCDLLLEVFNDDRETVRWSASTRIDYSNPYLVWPDQYAEQEIDPASGSATLGTVNVTVIDKPEDPGDQQTGFVTARLAYQTLADIEGRRSRLLRAIGAPGEITLEVVIDGVAGVPRMDSSYAAYSFEIRDTREVERKIRCFDGSVKLTGELLQGGNSILPFGPVIPYGLNPDTDNYLIAGAGFLEGIFLQNHAQFPNFSTGSVALGSNPDDLQTLPVETYRKMAGQATEVGPIVFPGVHDWERVRFTDLMIGWRFNDTGDPYILIDPAHLVMDTISSYRRYNLGVVTTDLGEIDGIDSVRVDTIAFGSDEVAPAGRDPLAYTPFPVPYPIPGSGAQIEFNVFAAGSASLDNPYHIEGMTAGQFAKNVYDGLYSARGPDGEIVPTGILYDEDALLRMTDPVRMRITEPIIDGRDWLEKYIYTPTGWIPALDRFGRISPVSQTPPEDIFSLPLIYDAITEPAPEWNAGERIINIIRFTYPRDFVPNTDEGELPETGDGLSDRDVITEFIDPVSVDRNGQQVLEIDGRAFRELGTTYDPGTGLASGEPLLVGGQPAELAFQLAQERGRVLLHRYAFGAPTMIVNVRRDILPDLRCGSWVRVFLSWFPDYITGQRGLIALCQIVAINDIDCVWRRITMEQAVPLTLYEIDEGFRTVLLTGKTGKFLTGKSGLPLTGVIP